MDVETFLHDIEVRLGTGLSDTKKIVNAVLSDLHDRLTEKEANDLGAQLPGEIKRMWHRLDTPGREVRRIHKVDFIRHVSDAAGIPEDEGRRAVMAVFKVLQLSMHSRTGQEGEAWDVFSQLPKDLKQVWLASAAMEPKKPKAAPPKSPS
jgi:uncharacterized protein (DUF2267 family)